jgi:hypothetical protein
MLTFVLKVIRVAKKERCAGEKKLQHQLLVRRQFFPKLYGDSQLPTFWLLRAPFSRQIPRPSKVANENVIIALCPLLYIFGQKITCFCISVII